MSRGLPESLQCLNYLNENPRTLLGLQALHDLAPALALSLLSPAVSLALTCHGWAFHTQPVHQLERSG